MSIVYVNAANVPANTAERYAACGREIRPGVWELDNTSECYRALAIEFAPPAKGIEGERATRRNADQTNWPRAARLISRFAVESDAGVGDTIARHIDRRGGRSWKRWYRRIAGVDCGCAVRQAKLNRRYPYTFVIETTGRTVRPRDGAPRVSD